MKTSFRWLRRMLASTLLLATVALRHRAGRARLVDAAARDHTTINMDGDIVSLSNLGGWPAMRLIAGLFVRRVWWRR